MFISEKDKYLPIDILANFRQSLKSEGYSTPTVKNYVSDTRHVILWIKENYQEFKFEKISESTLRSYRSYLKEKFRSKPAIAARRLSSLRKFLSWAAAQGLVAEDLLKSLHPLLDPREIVFKTFTSPTPSVLAGSLPSQEQTKKDISSYKLHQKILHHIKYTRPSWYQRYHKADFAHTLHLVVLIIYALGVGSLMIYTLVIKPALDQENLKRAALEKQVGSVLAATAPPSVLSFQGRLTDSNSVPVSTLKTVVFKIYTARTGGSLLWTSKDWGITPDQNGIFSVCLGDQTTTDDCLINGVADTAFPSDLFTDNAALYLDITVAGETLTPRQRIASVSYALNSGALAGFLGSQSPGANQVPILDGSGNLVFGGAATIGTASGNLTLDSASTLVISDVIDANGGDGSDFAGSVTFNDDVTLTLAGSENIDITNSTISTADGLIDLNVTVPGSQSASGLNINLVTDANSTTTAYAAYISATQNATLGGSDHMYGLYINFEDGTGSLDPSTSAFIALNNDDPSSSSKLPDGIILTAATGGGILDAIDVSDDDIDNALNLGTNTILASGSFTIDLVNGSDATLTIDNSGAGIANLTVSGAIAVSSAALNTFSKFDVTNTTTLTGATDRYGGTSTVSAQPTSTSSGTFIGFVASSQVLVGTGVGITGEMIGLRGQIQPAFSNTAVAVAWAKAVQGIFNGAANTAIPFTNFASFYANNPTLGGATITNNYGLYVANQTAGGTDYGIYVEDAANYSLYLASTDGDAASGITFGADTNLYRSAANTLTTDDTFNAAAGLKGAGLSDCDGSGSKLLWDSTTSNFSCGSDRASVSIVKSADECVDSDGSGCSQSTGATLQDDDELTFAVGTNQTWIVQARLDYTSGTTPDIAATFTAPSGSTCVLNTIDYDEGPGATANTACGTGMSATTDSGTDEVLEVNGTIITGGSSGSITLQWAQRVADVGNTVVHDGTYLIAWRVDGADLAEIYYSKALLAPGTLVSIDSSLETGVKTTEKAYDTSVLGVVTTKPGLVLGSTTSTGGAPTAIALTGRVPVKVSTENGPILPGDPLTSSSTPGVAMKATRSGPIIGKALESFDCNLGSSGANNPPPITNEPCQGKIMVFVSTGWYVNSAELNTKSPEFSNIKTTSLSSKSINSEYIATNQINVGQHTIGQNGQGDLSIKIDQSKYLEITNQLGEVIAWISDKGEAFFKKIEVLAAEIQKLTVKEEVVLAKKAQISGTAKFEYGDNQVKINSGKVTKDSLIYITPAAKTDGLILYLKEKKEGEYFIVELDQSEELRLLLGKQESTPSASKAIEFNWLIINQE